MSFATARSTVFLNPTQPGLQKQGNGEEIIHQAVRKGCHGICALCLVLSLPVPKAKTSLSLFKLISNTVPEWAKLSNPGGFLYTKKVEV